MRRRKERSKDYYQNYERRRKNGGKLLKQQFKTIMKMVRKFPKTYPEYKPMLCVVMTWLMMKKYSCSMCRMVEECQARPGLCKKLGLGNVPSKSWLHKWMKSMPIGLAVTVHCRQKICPDAVY